MRRRGAAEGVFCLVVGTFRLTGYKAHDDLSEYHRGVIVYILVHAGGRSYRSRQHKVHTGGIYETKVINATLSSPPSRLQTPLAEPYIHNTNRSITTSNSTFTPSYHSSNNDENA